MNYVSLCNPIFAGRHLSLMRSNDEFGFTYERNLNIEDNSYIGFTLKTNSLGLKGNDNLSAENVVLGTSYGMGQSVDDGKNWYQLNDKFKDFLNLSFPSSLCYSQNFITKNYIGKGDKLLILYHHNFWKIAWQMQSWDKAGRPYIFDYFRWSMSPGKCTYLSLKKAIKILLGNIVGKNGLYLSSGQCHTLNYTNYFFHEKHAKEVIGLFSRSLNALSKRFKKIYVVRLPFKEQLLIKAPTHCARLQKNADFYWKNFTELCQCFDIHDILKQFSIDDFHQYDNHLNSDGNRKLNNILSELI